MKPGAHIVVARAARTFAPLLALFALTLVTARAPGEGVGAVSAVALMLALALHALVFGAAAFMAAFPPLLMRWLAALGVIAALAGAGAPEWRYAPQAIEAGLFVTASAGAALIIAVLFGRAAALGDAED